MRIRKQPLGEKNLVGSRVEKRRKEIKKEFNIQVLDSNRETEIIERLKQYEKYPGTVEALWPMIMNLSKEIQK